MWQKELAAELKESIPTERKNIISRYMEMTGHSSTHLYRIAREHGFNTGRKKRADKGSLKSNLTEQQIEFIAGVLKETGRQNKGPIMPIERALQIAVDNGFIEEGQISVSRLTQILSERNLSAKHLNAPSPHITMRSLHPNHTHVVDVSICIQYYLKNGKLGYIDERDYNKNKPENLKKIKTRLLRYVVVDHFSGAMYLKYYDTTGETGKNLINFLIEAWDDKNDEKSPFRGVPFYLLMDAASANKSRASMAFFEKLGVNIPKGRPYNPQRQGAVETTHTIIENWFESGLRIQPATESIEQLNDWAKDFMVWYQSVKKHSRHGMPRFQRWMEIKGNELRELPPRDIVMDLYRQPDEERTVSGKYRISYRGKEFDLKHIEGLYRNAKVKASLNPWTWPEIDVIYNDETYQVKPTENLPAHLGGFHADSAIIGEEFKTAKETTTQQAEKRISNAAYGENKGKHAVPYAGLEVFGHHSEKVGSLSYMPKTGTPIEVAQDMSNKKITFTELLKKVRNEIGKVSTELNEHLKKTYGDSINIEDAEEVVRKLSNGETLIEVEQKVTELTAVEA